MGVRTPPPQPMETKKDIIKQGVLEYNAGVRAWNALPGKKLVWPKDKFKITYCDCKKPGTIMDIKVGKEKSLTVKTCKKCGYPLPGEWDD